jgi:hypothetical protein
MNLSLLAIAPKTPHQAQARTPTLALMGKLPPSRIPKVPLKETVKLSCHRTKTSRYKKPFYLFRKDDNTAKTDPPISLQFLISRDHIAKRTLLDHKTHNLIEGVSRGHGGMLSVSVVSRSDLDNVSADEVNAFEAADDSAEFAGGPAAGFRGASCRGDCSNRDIRQAPGNRRREESELDLQAGSRVSISIERYTGLVRPTRCLILSMIPWIPMISISRASIISKPQ